MPVDELLLAFCKTGTKRPRDLDPKEASRNLKEPQGTSGFPGKTPRLGLSAKGMRFQRVPAGSSSRRFLRYQVTANCRAVNSNGQLRQRSPHSLASRRHGTYRKAPRSKGPTETSGFMGRRASSEAQVSSGSGKGRRNAGKEKRVLTGRAKHRDVQASPRRRKKTLGRKAVFLATTSISF